MELSGAVWVDMSLGGSPYWNTHKNSRRSWTPKAALHWFQHPPIDVLRLVDASREPGRRWGRCILRPKPALTEAPVAALALTSSWPGRVVWTAGLCWKMLEHHVFHMFPVLQSWIMVPFWGGSQVLRLVVTRSIGFKEKWCRCDGKVGREWPLGTWDTSMNDPVNHPLWNANTMKPNLVCEVTGRYGICIYLHYIYCTLFIDSILHRSSKTVSLWRRSRLSPSFDWRK